MRKYLYTTIATTMLIASGCTSFSPIAATSNPVQGRKGESCTTKVLGVIPIGGTPTVYAAAKQGNISKISTVDAKTTGFFPFFHQECTIVRGQ